MKKIGIIIFALVVLSLPIIKYINSSKEDDYCKYANKITIAFRSSVIKKYGLVGIRGGGSFMDNVKMLSISFDTLNKEYNIDQSRVLMVNCAEEYLDKINSDEKVRPFLADYPFSEKGLELGIHFYEKKFEKVNENYIARVSLINEKLFFSIYDRKKNTYVKVYEEPYQEALKKVKDEGLLLYERKY